MLDFLRKHKRVALPVHVLHHLLLLLIDKVVLSGAFEAGRESHPPVGRAHRLPHEGPERSLVVTALGEKRGLLAIILFGENGAYCLAIVILVG